MADVAGLELDARQRIQRFRGKELVPGVRRHRKAPLAERARLLHVVAEKMNDAKTPTRLGQHRALMIRRRRLDSALVCLDRLGHTAPALQFSSPGKQIAGAMIRTTRGPLRRRRLLADDAISVRHIQMTANLLTTQPRNERSGAPGRTRGAATGYRSTTGTKECSDCRPCTRCASGAAPVRAGTSYSPASIRAGASG